MSHTLSLTVFFLPKTLLLVDFSLGGAEVLYAFLLPFLRPVATSRRLAQQHISPKCIKKPKILNAAPTHMKPNIWFPSEAPIFKPAWLVIVFRKITNITVAMAVAIAVSRAAIKVQKTMARLHQREYSTIGVMKMETVFMQIPVRKQPNMTWLAILISLRMLFMFAGRATVAPESSSFRMISTGLNQYSDTGFEQRVMPSSL
jgi:hypothetical protein